MQSTPAAMEGALPGLLEKVLSAGHTIVLRCENNKRLQQLNDALWTYSPTSFMPHNIMEKGMECETPISLTSENENPNNANILITVSGANAEDKEKYDRVLDIFEGSEIQRTAARKRWQTYKEEGAELAYFANEGGKWVKKA
jgi:DNA polymerase-3 subunit chi